MKNWAGNLTYHAAEIVRPNTTEELQDLVAKRTFVKAVGSRHSFSGIANTEHCLISTENLQKISEFDTVARTVTVESGVRYGELASVLHEQGWALPNLASLPHISVVGACATATHGSGVANGCLSTSVSGLEIVKPDGTLFTVRRGERDFEGHVVAIGLTGIVSRITLDLVPTFEIAQTVFEGLPFSTLEEHFDQIMGMAYSVSLFTTWNSDFVNQVWVKDLAGSEVPAELFGAKPAQRQLAPIADGNPAFTTPQLRVPGPWHERLPHFRMGFTPSSGDELQTEYLLPRKFAWEALSSLNRICDSFSPLLHVSEIRTVASDSLWMSPAYGIDSVCIHFTWKLETEKVMAVLPQIEEVLAPFSPRPHWGKITVANLADLAGRYSRFGDFRILANSFDPDKKFQNSFGKALFTE
jgi:alditol oxidase